MTSTESPPETSPDPPTKIAADKILLLGVGNTALALADLIHKINSSSTDSVLLSGTTRSAAKKEVLAASGIVPLLDDGQRFSLDLIEAAADEACVLISYPPDASGASDRRYAPLLTSAAKIVYISSTGVYDGIEGAIDEATALPDQPSEGARLRLASEDFWRERGACVLRAPGLYGPESGLHLRLLAGSYSIPGDGSNYVSRIHLDDLAAIIAAAFVRAEDGALYLVGDLKPAQHLEVVGWLCEKLSLPLPPFLPLNAVPPTLRGNRRIDASLLRKDFGLDLRYPTYVEGFSDCLRRCSALRQS
ncbi:MAG: hypothetical protein KGS72_02580 [Cyanobacteria bacterium REEB67]|nr:hypothetical protein [Cyanobacteria bacterium REEB67]